jgi:hypothetical protein
MTYDNWKTTDPADRAIGWPERDSDDDLMVIVCEACDGEGEWDDDYSHHVCRECGGKGQFLGERQPAGPDRFDEEDCA